MSASGRIAGLLAVCLLLSSCAAPSVWAPDAEVERARHVTDGSPRITLVTVENVRSGAGAHSALLIEADQRVLFDPAGTFRHPHAPERNDLLFGITDRVWSVYVDYHARETYDVRLQTLAVPQDVARAALKLAERSGPVPQALCSQSVARILNGLPGFEGFPVSLFPNRTAEAFGRLNRVSERRVTDDDADDNHGVLIVAAARAQPNTADKE